MQEKKGKLSHTHNHRKADVLENKLCEKAMLCGGVGVRKKRKQELKRYCDE